MEFEPKRQQTFKTHRLLASLFILFFIIARAANVFICMKVCKKLNINDSFGWSKKKKIGWKSFLQWKFGSFEDTREPEKIDVLPTSTKQLFENSTVGSRSLVA